MLVNIYPPFDRSQLEDFASQNNVPIDFLTDSLDTDERSRYESEEEIDLRSGQYTGTKRGFL